MTESLYQTHFVHRNIDRLISTRRDEKISTRCVNIQLNVILNKTHAVFFYPTNIAFVELNSLISGVNVWCIGVIVFMSRIALQGCDSWTSSRIQLQKGYHCWMSGLNSQSICHPSVWSTNLLSQMWQSNEATVPVLMNARWWGFNTIAWCSVVCRLWQLQLELGMMMLLQFIDDCADAQTL